MKRIFLVEEYIRETQADFGLGYIPETNKWKAWFETPDNHIDALGDSPKKAVDTLLYYAFRNLGGE